MAICSSPSCRQSRSTSKHSQAYFTGLRGSGSPSRTTSSVRATILADRSTVRGCCWTTAWATATVHLGASRGGSIISPFTKTTRSNTWAPRALHPRSPAVPKTKRAPARGPFGVIQHRLLHAIPMRIGLGFIHHHPMVQVRHRRRDVVHKLRHVRQLVVVDVLRLVRHLMVVAVIARREERDGNAVARVHVVIAPAVVLLRMPRGVELIIERERLLPSLVHGLDQIAELGREPARADELQVSRTAASLVVGAAPAHHVHVELRHDRVARDRRMVREILR